MTAGPNDAEFSVYWWDKDGGQHAELRFVHPKKAVLAAHRLTRGPASLLGVVDRVIITDGGDCICFEWQKAAGVTWPRRKASLITRPASPADMAEVLSEQVPEISDNVAARQALGFAGFNDEQISAQLGGAQRLARVRRGQVADALTQWERRK